MLLMPVRLSSYALCQKATTASRTRRTGLARGASSATWATPLTMPAQTAGCAAGATRLRLRGALPQNGRAIGVTGMTGAAAARRADAATAPRGAGAESSGDAGAAVAAGVGDDDAAGSGAAGATVRT